MITLNYQLSPSWNRKTNEVDLASADETVLRYEVLLGDVILNANGHDFSAKWGWVPVVDFAASLRHIVNKLNEQNGLETKFEFTESEAALRFKRNDDMVLISASYASGEAHVPLAELTASVESFSRRVASELSQQFPPLCENKPFQQLLSVPAQ